MHTPLFPLRPSPEREPPAPVPARGRFSRAASRSPPPAELGREDLMLGRYRLLERLGAGGFGVVWRARDELLQREVALKRIWLGPDGDIERATREAHATARLSHPAIVALYEACAQDGAFYLVSELVHGPTLASLIATEDLDDEEVLEIGLALVAALSHAHARGVIHRDIKPHNVLIPDRSRQSSAAAKLTDFGGASLVGEEALTRTGDVLGTLAYMAPEQSEGADVGEQADLYALALVLYEALTGSNPVRASTPAATVRRIGRRVEALGRLRRDLPRSLTSALDRALAPDPAQRGELEELGLSLEKALERCGARSRRGRPRPSLDAQARRDDRVEATLRRSSGAPAGRASATIAHEATALSPRQLATRSDHGAERDYGPQPHPSAEPPDGAGEPRPAGARRVALPRGVWAGAGLLLCAWQAWAGRPGLALLLAAALAPVAGVPRELTRFGARPRLGWRWLGCSLAPALGVVGLAGAFPALAGQARRWRERAALGALGYWWLTLAEPLLGARLWLGEAAGTPPRPAWESSLGVSAAHVIAPTLTLGVLLGALLWAGAALLLPWLVRGASATLDVLLAAAWSAGLLLASPALDSGLRAHALHPLPRGAVIGALIGAMVAVGARALRGPV